MDKFINELTKNLTDQKLLCENCLFIIGPITALIAAKFGRRAWIKYEIALTAICALILAFKPNFILSHVLKSEVKPFHQLLTSGYACYLVNMALAVLFTRNSQDESILYGHYYARIVEHSLIIVEKFVAYNEGIHWNYKYLCLTVTNALTHLIINVYFLNRTPKPSGQNPFKDLANSIGKLDFFICLVSGAFVYAFPDTVNLSLAGAGVLNESYRSLTRSAGALVIATSLHSFCLSEYKFIRDKKAFLFSRLLATGLELSVIFSGYYCFHIYTLERFFSFASFSVVYLLFIFYGYHNTPNEHIKAH